VQEVGHEYALSSWFGGEDDYCNGGSQALGDTARYCRRVVNVP